MIRGSTVHKKSPMQRSDGMHTYIHTYMHTYIHQLLMLSGNVPHVSYSLEIDQSIEPVKFPNQSASWSGRYSTAARTSPPKKVFPGIAWVGQ